MLYINQPKLIESSGLCRSLTTPGLYYSINDAGNAPILYGFNELGENLGEFPISVKATDCEAISSALVNGVPTIILADIGDNNCTRLSYRLNVIAEGTSTNVPTFNRSINFTYPDGKKRNCEACVLLPNGKIILITKSYPPASGPTQIFTITSWLSGDSGTICFAGPVLSAKLGTVTDADYKDGVITLMGIIQNVPTVHFFNAGNWTPFRSVKCEKAYQAEAMCLSHDGTKILVTSETNKTAGAKTPLYLVSI